MRKEEIKKRIEKLKKTINYHRYLYHMEDREEISESALDSLKKELFDLEQKFPEFITPDSPTQRIGGEPLKDFKKVKHPQKMLSFNDAFSKEDMQDWLERISKLLILEERQKIDFYCELKIDGLAVELIYENGFLKVGSTRGDGFIGEDVTQNLKTIESIPLKIQTDNLKNPKEIIVRGEAFISKNDFENINNLQKKMGLPLYANPRNIVAGSVRQLDSKITSKRKLDFFAYELITNLGQNTHQEKHRILEELGFKINKHNKYCKNLKEVFEFHSYWKNNRQKLDYEIDGIVVLVNNNEIFEKLGVVGKAPRGGIAFKFPLIQATTGVQDIKVQVGRTGAITPVAILKPVNISGVTITRATLHNQDEISRLGIKIGDTVVVGRAGDVIPDIVSVFKEMRTGKEVDFKMPLNCPACGVKLEKSETESLLRCPNTKCFARTRRGFYHFVSKSAFNIEGLGPKIINRLLDEGLVVDPSDIFNLKEGDLLQLERFGEKSVKNLIKAISEKTKITLPKFIFALGIRNVGEQTAIDLAKEFKSIENLRKVKLRDLENILNIGPVVAKSIFEWFGEKDNIKFLENLQKSVKIENEKFLGLLNKNQKLLGKTFVLTGTLQTMHREIAKEKIRKLGGIVSDSISLKTDYLVVGENPGSKKQKAEKLGVKILEEKNFLDILF